MQYRTEPGKCITAPPCIHWGCRRQRDGIRLLLRECRSQNVRARASSAGWMLCISILRKYSTNTGSIVSTTGSRSRVFPRFAVLSLTWHARIPNPTLGSRDNFMQNMWDVFQARSRTQASLYSGMFPAIPESYSLVCGLSLLLLADLINSPACSSDMGCPNTAQAVGRSKAVAAD